MEPVCSVWEVEKDDFSNYFALSHFTRFTWITKLFIISDEFIFAQFRKCYATTVRFLLFGVGLIWSLVLFRSFLLNFVVAFLHL